MLSLFSFLGRVFNYEKINKEEKGELIGKEENRQIMDTVIRKNEDDREIIGAVMAKEDKSQELIDLVFSWSIADVMNKDMYRDKVMRIPTDFPSAYHYLNAFYYPLVEETHADLLSRMETLSQAPSCEIYDVKMIENNARPNDFLYKLILGPGAYEPGFGDLIALTEVKPNCIDDLDRPKRPYLIALIEGMETEHENSIPIRSSKPILFEKECDTLFAVNLTNLITNSRIWRFLHPDMDGANLNIINSVLRHNPSVHGDCSFCLTNQIESVNVSKSREIINPFGLDNAQNAAVLNTIAVTECHHRNSVKLIWGPPGTGKTKTVATLLFALFKMKHKALTCAPTNVAVLGVTKRLMSFLSGTLTYETYGLGDIVLFGNGKRMKIDDHEDLYDVFLDHRALVLSHCFAPLTGWKGSLETMICLLEDPKDQYNRYLRTEEKEQKEKYYIYDGNEVEVKNEGKTEKCNKVGALERNFWKKLIIRDLEENKKKRSKRKMRSRVRNENKYDEISSISVRILWTFEEFITNTFKNIRKQLMLCITGLYTHMPTSRLPLETVEKMIRVLEILETLKTLPSEFDASDKNFLEGNEETGRSNENSNFHQITLEFLAELKFLRSAFSLPVFFRHDLIKNFCIKNACLIFCTASSSAKLHTVRSNSIELVLIDEAAQLKECESCIPLQIPGVRHAILVGDEKQLPATVQSKIGQKANFGRSLFERLVILRHDKHLLNVQYRMHPSISFFPNWQFYGGKIQNGENVREGTYERRFLKGEMFGFYSFIDINNGIEESDNGHSLKNIVEISVVAEIVSKLHEESLRSKQKVSVGCISPYKAQVQALQEKLGKTYSTDSNEIFSVNVRSVDGFQGGEEDIIIISTVRCNGNGSVGFLDNFQRTNVALTRARYCLWILGNAATLLNSGSVWKKLVLDAKSRACFFNAYEDQSLALTISNALVDLGQINSLFTMDSILFRTSKWKVYFSGQFQESMIKFKHLGVNNEVVDLIVKLSNGWRKQLKDDGLSNMGNACSQLLEISDVKNLLKLIWSVEILCENSKDVQIIKIWDILPKRELPKVVKKIEAMLGNYTGNYMSRSLCKRMEGDLVLPMAWPVERKAVNARWDKRYDEVYLDIQ